MIADVIPAPMAMARNVPVMWCRLGSPKLTLLAPQVVLTPSSSRSRRTRRNTCWPGRPHGPDRHHERVDHDVAARDAVVGGAVHDALVFGEAEGGDDGGSMLGHQRQHPLHRLVLGRVTELTSGLPWWTASPASSAG